MGAGAGRGDPRRTWLSNSRRKHSSSTMPAEEVEVRLGDDCSAPPGAARALGALRSRCKCLLSLGSSACARCEMDGAEERANGVRRSGKK